MAGNYAPNYYGGGSQSSHSCLAPVPAAIIVPPERTTFVPTVPQASEGRNGDQAYITTGALQGAIYEKQAGAWVYVAQTGYVARTTFPSTAIMPAGFIFQMVAQADSSKNGLWQWDGTALTQIAHELA